MRFNLKPIALAAGTASLSLAMAACHGQSPTSSGYIPADSTAITAPPAAGVENQARGTKSPIISLCGDVIKIKLLGDVRCKFKEDGYNGVFKLTNHIPGILELKPLIGDQTTSFLLGGLALGNGFFVVKDLRHNLKIVDVRIVLF